MPEREFAGGIILSFRRSIAERGQSSRRCLLGNVEHVSIAARCPIVEVPLNAKMRKQAKSKGTTENQIAPERERRARLLIALLCVGLSAIAVVPFFFMGQSESGGAFELRMPTTHDMFLHYDQMRSFYNGLAAGELYPRWEEDTNRGFGAPTMSFYPPGVYYVTSAFYRVTGDWVRALLDAGLLMMVASAAGVYIYARGVMGRAAAAAAMAAYVFLPYHLADLYHRGALAELLGFVWMPLMLIFCDRLMKAPRSEEMASNGGSMLISAAGLGLSYGGFLWSHPPTAYQFTLALGVYVLALAVMQREWRRLIAVCGAMVLGLAVSAAYLLPAALEQNLIHKEFISETWPYHDTYIFVHNLYTADLHRGFFKLLDWIWITGTAAIVGGAIILLSKKRGALSCAPALRQRVRAWVIVGGLASFMMTKASMPVGKLIPKIDIGVFTWRMLSITTLVVALLVGALVEASVKASHEGQRRERLLLRGLAGGMLLVFMSFSAIAVVWPVRNEQVFEAEPEHLNYATIPMTAPADPEELPEETPRAELAGERGKVTVEEWKPQHRVVRAELREDDQLLVRTFNFPGWTATVDGRHTPIQTNEELGDMSIELPAGTHLVKLDFLDTTPRRVGGIITLVAGAISALLIAIWAFQRRRGHESA